jgi:oligopeptidase B
MSLPSAPKAEKKTHTSTNHGFTYEDPYHWLRADNWQEVMTDPSTLDQEIREYLEAENAYTENALKETDELQGKLFEELKGRIKQDDSSVPQPDGEWSYYISYVQDGEHPLYCRKHNETGEEVVLLDGNKLSEGKAYFQFGGISHSPNHELLAWSVDEKGSEYYRAYIRDLKTGQDLEQTIEKTTGNVCWGNGSDTLYYVLRDDNHRPAYVHRHLLNEPGGSDELVYQEHDPGFFVNIGNTQSNKFVVINASGHETSEWHLIDANDPAAKPFCVSERVVGHEYSLEEREGTLYILTNKEGAEDFKIVTTPVDKSAKENWQDFIPHKQGRLIIDINVFADFLVRLERENGLPRIVIRDLNSNEEHAIEFDEEAYSLGLSSGYEFKTDLIRFTYSSMTTPAQIFDYNMKTRDRDLRKTQEIPSGHTIEDYVTRRVMADAHDGEKIPVTLLYKKGTPIDGSAPLFLYGYGSYGISMPAGFYANHLSLVDRGLIYAIAHIRGGKEKGYNWYKTGKMEHKTNSFKDFISAGEYLVKENFTSKGRIVAHGGSAGGMLMGAVVNMSPDLFAGIIAEVPFVDVLNTMLDDTLPLTPPEWPEWGNPIESKEAYERIKSYSPYDNVAAQNYPPMLVMAGLTDPRVTYWEPAKWVAKLRDTKTDENMLCLKTNMEAGHGGASGRFDHLKEVALVQSFALKVANLI